MRNITYILGLLCISFSCRFAEVEVDSDYSYSGKFNRYKTFTFVQNQAFSGVEKDKEIIEHNITRVLQSWGYRYKKGKSDIMISYDFYFEDVTMRGYNQPEFHSWVHTRFGKDLTVQEIAGDSLLNEEEIRRRDEKYHAARMKLNEGTVYISFLDRRREQSIWQGYASGVFEGDVFKNERKLRAAIIRILDEFRLITPST